MLFLLWLGLLLVMPQVIANCLTLLMQVQGVKRLASNKALLYNLINRIKVCPPRVVGSDQLVAMHLCLQNLCSRLCTM